MSIIDDWLKRGLSQFKKVSTVTVSHQYMSWKAACGVDPALLASIDTTNDQSIEQLIGLMPAVELQRASRELLKVIDSSAAACLRTTKRDRLLEILCLRIGGYTELDIQELGSLTAEQLVASATNIVAALPLYGDAYSVELQYRAVPLILGTSSIDMESAAVALFQYLNIGTYLMSCCQSCTQYIKGNPGKDISASLTQALEQAQVELKLHACEDKCQQTLFNIALFYAKAHAPTKYDGNTISRTADPILDTENPEFVKRVAYELCLGCITTAAVRHNFDLATLQAVKRVFVTLDAYAANATPENKRFVYANLLVLPVAFRIQGEMSQLWAEAIILICRLVVPAIVPVSEDYVELLKCPGKSFTVLLECIPTENLTIIERVHRHVHKHIAGGHRSKNGVPYVKPVKEKIVKVKVIPEPVVIKKVVKIKVAPPPIIVKKVVRNIVKVKRNKGAAPPPPAAPEAVVNDEPAVAEDSTDATESDVMADVVAALPAVVLRCMKLIETSRAAARTCASLEDAMKENQSAHAISQLAQDLTNRATTLHGYLSESKDASSVAQARVIADAIAKVTEVVNSYTSDDKSSVSFMEPLVGAFQRVTQEIIAQLMNSQGMGNLAASELALMTQQADSLQSQMENDHSVAVGDNPLWQLVSQEAKVLLKMTRNIGREAQSQAAFLTRINEAVGNERGLINATMQTSEACQMFFLLNKLFQSKDEDIVYKVIAACGQMRQGLANIIVNLRAKGGSKEISKRIEAIAETVFSRLNVVKEAAMKTLEDAIVEKPTGAGMNLIIHRRNAADKVLKCQRELEEAEEEVKRLNRLSARR